MNATPPAPPVAKLSLRSKIAWIWGYWRPHRGFLVFLFFFTLLSSAVTIAYPMVFKVVLDRLSQATGSMGGSGADIPEPAVRQVLLILAAIAAGRFIAGFYPSFRAWMNLKIDVDVRAAVFARILGKDFRFFNRFGTGDLVTRLMDDISEYPKISWFCCSGIFRAVDSASRLLFCVAAMLFLHWKLTLIALLPLPFMMYVLYRVRARLTEAGLKQQQAISETNEMLEKAFSGIRIVKAFGAEPGQAQALARILERRIGVQYRLQKLWTSITTFDSVATRVGQLVVLALGGVLAARGEITIGTIYAFYVYLDMLVQPMWDLPNLVVTSRQAFVCIDREEEITHFPVTVSHPAAGERLGRLATLEFDRVTFGYDGTRPAVADLSFRIARGETVAVVGPVAAGKSTLLKLAAGLLVPDSGALRINGRPLAEWRWDGFRDRLGYTPQDSLLFSESIRENVTMGRGAEGAAGGPPRAGDGDGHGGRSEAGVAPAGPGRPEAGVALGDGGRRGAGAELGRSSPEAWVHRVLAVAQMEAELANLPEGIDTTLGQKGSKISGGQRQRVSIARALYGRPELLLLDDCTASLDAENEDRLWAGLRAILPDTTVLLVSHRLATIRRAGRILVLDQGRLSDQGTHEELAGRSEVYRRFLERAEERARVLESA